MNQQRISRHPVLENMKDVKIINFTFNGRKLTAHEGEAISSALFANGIKVFGHHHKDNSPQGIFCANGQCSQCTVIANGKSVKACMTSITENMEILSAQSNYDLINQSPQKTEPPEYKTPVKTCRVLIIGAGPSGLSAAIELGKMNIKTILADDKSSPGGKLLLQTHQFFGSKEECYAGMRGIDIARKLEKEASSLPSVSLWLNSPVIGVFEDKCFGVLKNGEYTIVKPEKVIIATGARERSLPFEGWDLPGVYGAGAFQTLVNRDLIKPCKQLFVMGGGNVGLIAAYHAMQAGIKVCGLAEIMPEIGGYEVHALKIKRLGVPIYLKHTVIKCSGDENELKSVTICQVDNKFNPIKGTYREIPADTLLLALGLSPVEELFLQSQAMGINAEVCGDAREISEASAAMFSGRITAMKTAQTLGFDSAVSQNLQEKYDLLKSRPGKLHDTVYPENHSQVYPVIHCFQEIPCDPCTQVCPQHSINFVSPEKITSLPEFTGKCSGCCKCVLVCPGLAITLVDKRESPEKFVKITIPYELDRSLISVNQEVELTDIEGRITGTGKITRIREHPSFERRALVEITSDADIADQIAGFRLPTVAGGEQFNTSPFQPIHDNLIICRCERITAGEIREALRGGVRYFNELKSILRCTMGACGGKTCSLLINKILADEGIEKDTLTLRPLEMETTLGELAGRGNENF